MSDNSKKMQRISYFPTFDKNVNNLISTFKPNIKLKENEVSNKIERKKVIRIA